MSKLIKTALFVSSLAAALTATNASAFTKRPLGVPHFTDNISVKLNQFPQETLKADYVDSNGVRITGPATVNTSSRQFMVNIHSDNEVDNGIPRMILNVPNAGTCKFIFVDGPWIELDYRYGNPPTCNHLKISDIQQDGTYSYTINVTYTN